MPSNQILKFNTLSARKSVGSLTDSSKYCFFSYLSWLSIWVLLCVWLTRTRISAQFIAGFFFFFPLLSNTPLWKEHKNPCFTDGEVKQRQTLFSCSYTAHLNQNQTHALFPKVTFPASPRLLHNPIMGGRAMHTQLPPWIAPLKMWARCEFSVIVMLCFGHGFCGGLQKGRVGTVNVEPVNIAWEETGGCAKIHNHWNNSLTPQEKSALHFLHPYAVTLHCKSPELVLLESFDPCSVFLCVLKTSSPLPREKKECATPQQYCLWARTTNHLLCCAGTFLACFLLQLEAFLCPQFSLRRWPCVLGRVGPQQHCCGLGALLLLGSLPASSSQHWCHIYHWVMHTNWKYNRLTHLFPLVIDDLSWLS